MEVPQVTTVFKAPTAAQQRKSDLEREVERLRAFEEQIKFLCDPMQHFGYTITAEGKVFVKGPGAGLFPTMGEAIEYVKKQIR